MQWLVVGKGRSLSKTTERSVIAGLYSKNIFSSVKKKKVNKETPVNLSSKAAVPFCIHTSNE